MLATVPDGKETEYHEESNGLGDRLERLLTLYEERKQLRAQVNEAEEEIEAAEKKKKAASGKLVRIEEYLEVVAGCLETIPPEGTPPEVPPEPATPIEPIVAIKEEEKPKRPRKPKAASGRSKRGKKSEDALKEEYKRAMRRGPGKSLVMIQEILGAEVGVWLKIDEITTASMEYLDIDRSERMFTLVKKKISDALGQAKKRDKRIQNDGKGKYRLVLPDEN